MNYIEFSAKIKEKYPEYKDVDDLTLAQKIVEKYPEYKEKVNFEEVKHESVKKGGINLTPSGIANSISSNISAGLDAPIVALRDNIPLNEAFQQSKERIQSARDNDSLAKAQDFLTDMVGYSALPFARGGGAVNFIKNAVVQGGIPGALESLKNGGNVAGGAGLGTGIAAALQGINPVIAKGANKIIDSGFIDNMPKILEALTSVPAEYSERAIEKELAGNSLFKGKFDAKTAYKPIEKKIRQAKEALPNSESFADEYYKLGKKAVEGFENLKAGAGQEIGEMLTKLNPRPVEINGLKNSLDSLINSYSKGGEVNPAEILAGRNIDQVKNLLKIQDEKQTSNLLNDYFNKNRLINPEKNAELSKDAENAAFEILSQATGKNKQWLKSQLNANLPKQSTQKRQEFIEGLLESTADKIDNIEPTWGNYFPEVINNIENMSGEDVARSMFDKILNKDFARANDLISPAEQAINEASKNYDNLLYNMTKNPTKQGLNKSTEDITNIIQNLDDDAQAEFISKLSNDIENIEDIVNPKVKPIDLHNVKEILYDMANYDTPGGIRNDTLKGMANQINNYLRHIAPEYSKPNDIFSLIKSVEKDVGGLNQNTLGKKIGDIGSEKNIISGLDSRLKNVDTLLPEQNKFYNQAKELNAEREAINNILKTVNNQYERNPRLLANRTDDAFENAIEDLQKRTGVNFMEDLNDTRAREALENLFPGQGGGSGSSQGFGNLLRTSIIGGAPTAAAITRNPLSLLGLGMVSPKLMAQGTIKNIGKLSDMAKKATQGAYNDIIARLSNLGGKGAGNMLYGGVEYNDYQ